jgi:hypothetical protein
MDDEIGYGILDFILLPILASVNAFFPRKAERVGYMLLVILLYAGQIC